MSDRQATINRLRKNDLYHASGYGGQFMWVIPHLNLVAVITSSNYENGFWNFDQFRKTILPAVTDSKLLDQNVIAGSGEIVHQNVQHPNGNIYD